MKRTLLALIVVFSLSFAARSQYASLDPTFGLNGFTYTSFPFSVYFGGMKVLSDDKILCTGYSFTASMPRLLVVRYTANGQPDSTFGVNGILTDSVTGSAKLIANAVFAQPDGKIIVTGSYRSGTSVRFAAWRYNASGTSRDLSFGSGGIASAAVGAADTASQTGAGLLQPDGKVIIGGTARGAADFDFALVRFDSTGVLDASFGAGGISIAAIDTFAHSISRANDLLTGLALQPDGKIVACGGGNSIMAYDYLSSYSYFGEMARFNANGSLDQTFGYHGKYLPDEDPQTWAYGGRDVVNAVAIQANGTIVGVGALTYTGSGQTKAVFSFLQPDGIPDSSYSHNWALNGNSNYGVLGPQFFNEFDAVLIEDHDKILTGGGMGGNGELFTMGRYMPNGAIDTFYDQPTYYYNLSAGTAYGTSFGTVNALGIQTAGHKVIGAGIVNPGVFGLLRILPGRDTVACYIPTVSITAQQTSLCTASAVDTFTATVQMGDSNTNYQWYKNGVVVGANMSQQMLSGLADGDSIWLVVTNQTNCYGPATGKSNKIHLTLAGSYASSVSITASATSLCSGITDTFRATAVNTGFTPTYQWYRNGTAVGSNSSIYLSNTLTNGDSVWVVMTSSLGCAIPASAVSNKIHLNITTSVTPTVSITGRNILCSTAVRDTFFATFTNLGANGYVNWRTTGSGSGAITSNTQMILPVSANNDTISAIATSLATCATAHTITSNKIIVTIQAPVAPTAVISATGTVFCAGSTRDTFTVATTNAGAAPTYRWYKNGSVLSTAASYIATSLNNGDSIWVQLTSNAFCVSPTNVLSNKIHITVQSLVTPAVTVSASTTSFCNAPDTFTATPSNGGTSPVYSWRKNGAVVGPNAPVYITTALGNNDSVWCVMTSNATCASPATGTSAKLHISATAGVQGITTIAGNGRANIFAGGIPATSAELGNPVDVTSDSIGNIYIVEEGLNGIRKVDATTGLVSIVAGTGTYGASGDGGPATSAQLAHPVRMTIAKGGDIYFADQDNNVIRKIAAGTGIITTVAGNGPAGYHVGYYGGDSVLATSTGLYWPAAVKTDAAGNLYIADTYNNRIRKVSAATGIITTIAGTGVAGYSGDNGQAKAAKINNPTGLDFDAAGNLYIADYVNNRIRKIAAGTNVITTVAGTGVAGFSGDGLVATSAMLNEPSDVVIDGGGNIYITDLNNGRLRKVAAGTGIITTVAGANTGSNTFNGDAIPATSAKIVNLEGVCLDPDGNIYVADNYLNRVRKISPAGSDVPMVSATATKLIITAATIDTFTTTQVNGGSSPTYQWYKNALPVGANSATYITSGLHNNDSVWVTMTSNASCASPATATSIRIYLRDTLAAGSCPAVYRSLSQSICSGSSVTVGVHVYSSNGTYVDTLHTVNGCDSIITLTLTVTNAITSSVTTSICSGSSYAGHTASGTYTDHYTSASGCDSARTLNLTVANAITSNVTTSICSGSSYAGHTASGTYTDHYTSVSGCDSARTLNLTVANAITSNVTTSICSGSSYAGHTASGTFTDHYTSVSGCDSARTLNLTVSNAITSSVTTSICSGSSYAGHTASGTYTDHYTSVSGCDSARTLNLTVANAITSNVTTSICSGSSYAGHTASGNYTDHFTSVSGCDSARTLNLTVANAITSSITTSICSGSSYAGHTASGNYTDHYTSVSGCDSARTLNLTVANAITSNVTTSICSGSSYAGHTASGTYTDHYTSGSGCDSARTLNLTVANAITSNVTASICSGSSYAGHTASGTYTDHYTSASGCDSARTLNLTVANAITSSITTSVCSGSSYAGHTASGTYTDHYTSVSGCDSARTLNLTVANAITSSITTSVCSGSSYAGHTASGTYTDHYTSVSGCDSARTLSLTVANAVTSSITTTINSGQTYTVGAQTFGSTGNYTVTLPGAATNGCDSVVTLHLTVNGAACTPSVSVTCNNTNLDIAGTRVMTATPTNGGTNPVYNWYLNGTQMAGVHSSVLSYGGTLGNGDQIYCTMTPATGCGAGQMATGNTITFTKSGANAKDITTLTMPAQVGTSVINNVAATVNATVTTAPAGRTAIHPTRLYTSPNSTYGPSYANNQDFSHPVTYTVRAQDGSTKVWTVTVLDQSGNKTSSTAADMNALMDMSIYPDPAVSYLNVKATGGASVPVITILDMEGRVIYHQALPVTDFINHQIDLSGFAGGTYMIYVAVGEKLQTRKFVIEK